MSGPTAVPPAAGIAAPGRNGSGQIRVGDVDRAVPFTAADPTVRTQVDQAYRTKYGRYRSNYVRPMISDTVAETTLQLQPTIS